MTTTEKCYLITMDSSLGGLLESLNDIGVSWKVESAWRWGDDVVELTVWVNWDTIQEVEDLLSDWV